MRLESLLVNHHQLKRKGSRRLMYKMKFTDTGGATCSAWIDLLKFPVPETKITEVLGISKEQLTFARAMVLSGEYPGTYTTLYYTHCSVRVYRYIPMTFSQVLRYGCSYQVMELGEEEFYPKTTQNNVDIKLCKITDPDMVITTYLVDNEITGERISVHRGITIPANLLQYRYKGDISYPFMKRIELLITCSEDFIVSNTTIRDVLLTM